MSNGTDGTKQISVMDSTGRTASSLPSGNTCAADTISSDGSSAIPERQSAPRDVCVSRAILNMLGMAARSRRLVSGTDAVIAAVRAKAKPHIAAVASDASERSRKQLSDKCAFNGVPLITLAATRAELAAAIGRKNAQCSACAVTDRNMAKKIDILYHG